MERQRWGDKEMERQRYVDKQRNREMEINGEMQINGETERKGDEETEKQIKGAQIEAVGGKWKHRYKGIER